MKRLSDFKSLIKKPQLFVDTTQNPPQFLQTNLVDPARTIKIFSDDQFAFIKIFYFQFLKLCFESEGVDYESKMNRLIDLIQKEKGEGEENLFRSVIKGSGNLSQENYKQVILEFLQILSECKQPVQNSLARYSIAGKILLNFLVNFLIQEKVIENEKDQRINSSLVFQFLCEYFEINMVQFDDCFQFVDTEIYTYKENENNIYLIYIDDYKAMRNTAKTDHLNQIENEEIKSVKESEAEKSQMIVFEGSQVIFDQSVKKQFQCKVQDKPTKKSSFIGLDFKTTALTTVTEISNRTNKQNIGPNITKQFTNTFILDQVVEPYRQNVQKIKAKARAERKSRQFFFK